MNSKRQRFLAVCLLEALEDENLRLVNFVFYFFLLINYNSIYLKNLNFIIVFSNANALLIKYNTIPSIIIYSRGISPIHYASGMENIIFAEKIMKIMLKNKDGKFQPNIKIINYVGFKLID